MDDEYPAKSLEALLATAAPHAATDDCCRWHCYVHGVEEYDPKPYLICGECYHVFPTARALRRVYLHGWVEVDRRFVRSRWRRAFYRLRHSLTRTKSIGFCPCCSHSF